MPWLIHLWSTGQGLQIAIMNTFKELYVNPLMKAIKSQIVEKITKSSWDRKAKFQGELESLKKIQIELKLKLKILECHT